MNTIESLRGGQFLTFFLGNEEYGLEILKVQEIIGIQDITPVPGASAHILGVINLRGKVIQVLDLRRKFEMACIEKTRKACIIVVQAQGIEIGVQVDKVSEVVDIADQAIENVPSFGSASVKEDYLIGIGKSESNVKLLLDIDRIITFDEASTNKSVNHS